MIEPFVGWAMGIAARSRERVEDRLAGLEAAYGSFTVSQTTISLPAPRYERARERYRENLVDVYAQVRNEAGDVLHVDGDGTRALPGTAAGTHVSLEEGVCEAVERQTGVRCHVDRLQNVTITGLRNADEAEGETVYRLVVVFAASRDGGDANARAAWASEAEGIEPVVG